MLMAASTKRAGSIKCPVAPSIIISLALRRLLSTLNRGPLAFAFCQTLSVCIIHRHVAHMFTLTLNKSCLMQDGSVPTCIPCMQRPSSRGSPFCLKRTSQGLLLGAVYSIHARVCCSLISHLVELRAWRSLILLQRPTKSDRLCAP